MNITIDTCHAINWLTSQIDDPDTAIPLFRFAKILADFAVRVNNQLFEIMGFPDEGDLCRMSNHIAEASNPDDCEEDVIFILDLGECHPKLALQDKDGMMPWGAVCYLYPTGVRCYRPNFEHVHSIMLDYDAAISFIVTHLALQINAVIPCAPDQIARVRLAEILNHYERPRWQIKKCVGHGAFFHGKKVIPYAILSRNLRPDLIGFLGGGPTEHLFISEDVPEEYRAPQLQHEIIEHHEFPEAPNRCLLAVKKELQGISPDMRSNYLLYRRDFFNRLIAFHETNPQMVPDADFMRRITQSRDLLSALIEGK